MNIIRHEFRSNLKTLLIWIICIAAMLFLASTEFSSFKDNEEVDKMIASLPQAMVSALSLDTIRVDKVEGFFSYVV